MAADLHNRYRQEGVDRCAACGCKYWEYDRCIDCGGTEPLDDTAVVQLRDNGKWVVVYRGTVVGRHTAKYKAVEQARLLNE